MSMVSGAEPGMHNGIIHYDATEVLHQDVIPAGDALTLIARTSNMTEVAKPLCATGEKVTVRRQRRLRH